MKKQSLYIAFSVLCLSLTTSCNDALDVQPQQSIDTSVALTDEKKIQAAVIGLYDYLQNTTLYGRDMIAFPEALADNGRATGNSQRFIYEYENKSSFNNWRVGYRAINHANLILKAIPSVPMSESSRKGLEGQVHFLRALLYFDLMRAYAYMPGAVPNGDNLSGKPINKGGVPLMEIGVTSTEEIPYPKRASIDDVYAFIYKELEVAIEQLAATPVNRAPTYVTAAAANALLSRVALYSKDWENTVKYATNAITIAPVKLITDPESYLAGWRKAVHPESVFELVFTTAENVGVNFSLQTSFTTLREPGNRIITAGYGDLVPTNSLLSALYSENLVLTRPSTGVKDSIILLDVRQRLYELGTTGWGTAAIECTKFLGKNGTVNLDNVPVIRISEMYLNRAEANYYLNNRADALADVNAIRTRCGLPVMTDEALPGTALLTQIQKQRRIEFAFEGHRFFDLKRQGSTITKASLGYSIPFASPVMLAPIPLREIQINPNLEQNEGY